MNRFFSLILILSFLAGCTKSDKDSVRNQKNLRESAVVRGDIVQKVTISGNVVPIRYSLITAPYNGYVRKLYVSVGDSVKENAPLVSVVQSLQSSDHAYPMRAPFSGLVSQVSRLEGEYVTQSDANGYIMRLDDFSKLFINATVPEADRTKLRVNQAAVARATALGDKTYDAVIREIAFASKAQNSWSETQVLYPVRLELLKTDKELVSGLSVLVDVETAKKSNVLQVGVEFVEKKSGKYFVTLKDGVKKEITIGIQNEEMVEVVSGLKEGDLLQQIDFSAIESE